MPYAKINKQTRGWKGIDFGGNPHLIDAMIILKPIWWDNKGKYTGGDGIKLKYCCQKVNIIPVSRECDINNYVGRSSVPISMKTNNKDDC